MLAVLKNAPSFGYAINTYEHCLQAATMVMEDGHDEATIVAALFHDIFLEISDANHGQAVAEFLHPFLSDKNYWMLRHHGYFIIHHCHSHPTVDTEARERWRNHEYFDWTVEFARKYDQISIRPDYRTAPLSEFEPMVRRLLERPVRDIPDPE
jgi:predicted HD phosphohydrolase